MQERSVFRKESLDRISSPEQIDDYIHIASPGIWFVLIAVLLLLGGVITWGVAGRFEGQLFVESPMSEAHTTAEIP